MHIFILFVVIMLRCPFAYESHGNYAMPLRNKDCITSGVLWLEQNQTHLWLVECLVFVI